MEKVLKLCGFEHGQSCRGQLTRRLDGGDGVRRLSEFDLDPRPFVAAGFSVVSRAKLDIMYLRLSEQVSVIGNHKARVELLI